MTKLTAEELLSRLADVTTFEGLSGRLNEAFKQEPTKPAGSYGEEAQRPAQPERQSDRPIWRCGADSGMRASWS